MDAKLIKVERKITLEEDVVFLFFKGRDTIAIRNGEVEGFKNAKVLFIKSYGELHILDREDLKTLLVTEVDEKICTNGLFRFFLDIYNNETSKRGKH